MRVSAYESVEFTNNDMDASCINITSYTDAANAKVVATDNKLDETQDNRIGSASKLFTAANVTAQDDIEVYAQ